MKKEKRRLLEISITTVKILLCAMLLFNALVFIVYGLIDRGDVIEKETVRFIKDWNITENENGDQTLTTILPGDIKDNEYLYFDTRKDVYVYVNGEFRKDFIEKRDVNIPGGSYKRFLIPVPLKESDSGTEITVVRCSVQEVDKEAPEFFVATRYGALSYLFKTVGPLFVLSLIVLIFSFVCFVISIVLRLWYKQRIDLTYGALGIFIIAAWLISDSFLFPFAFGVNHLNGLLSFTFCLMMPLSLGVYLSAIQRGRYKKSMSALLIVAFLNAVIFPFLHFTGIIPYYNLLNLANFVLVLLAASGIAILVVDAVRGNIGEYRYTFIGFLGFLVSCLIELINIIFSISIVRETIPMVVGLAFLLAFIVIQQVHDLGLMNMEKQHAIDISEAKTRFLASMSHEIRTPINAILGMNEMIFRENKDSTIDEYSRNIKTSGKMLLMLVNDVLDFTKIEAGKLEIKEADFLMSDMLSDVISLIKERAEEKSLELRTVLDGEIPNEMISDEFRLRQILVNLMNNAVKYTEKGTVSLKVGGSYTEDGYELSLLVADTGKGIRKEDQEHLFEAFSRADLKSNASIEGTGLGLAIVKCIVESMNGSYGVESEYGVGSQFWVKIPVKYKSRKALEKDFFTQKSEQPHAAGSNLSFTAPDAKILAVDDNQSNLTIVKLFLKKNGIVPDLCSTGTQAAELCKEKKYDLILLDHMMPEPDGIETLHMIRNDADSLNKETKAVVLTANAVAGSRQMYLNEGFDDYLTKPLDSTVLEETVRNLLPADKVIEASGLPAEAETQSLREKLSVIEGLDYDTALLYCGDDEGMLREIITAVAAECAERAERMKKSLEEKDIKAYRIDAHTIKGSMATLGIASFSERAKKHEYAARDNDIDFINANAAAFIDAYVELCGKLEKIC